MRLGRAARLSALDRRQVNTRVGADLACDVPRARARALFMKMDEVWEKMSAGASNQAGHQQPPPLVVGARVVCLTRTERA